MQKGTRKAYWSSGKAVGELQQKNHHHRYPQGHAHAIRRYETA